MGQLGFFDADRRLEALSARGDPLEAIDRLVPWESFRAEIEAVVLTPDELKKSSAGRKPFDLKAACRHGLYAIRPELETVHGDARCWEARLDTQFLRGLGDDGLHAGRQ